MLVLRGKFAIHGNLTRLSINSNTDIERFHLEPCVRGQAEIELPCACSLAMGTGNVLPSGVGEAVFGVFAYNLMMRFDMLGEDIKWRR